MKSTFLCCICITRFMYLFSKEGLLKLQKEITQELGYAKDSTFFLLISRRKHWNIKNKPYAVKCHCSGLQRLKETGVFHWLIYGNLICEDLHCRSTVPTLCVYVLEGSAWTCGHMSMHICMPVLYMYQVSWS